MLPYYLSKLNQVFKPEDHLTNEQIDLITVYREKWRAIAFQTGAIAQKEATTAVKAAYAAIGEKEPEIIFCASPFAALKHKYFRKIENQLATKLEWWIIRKFLHKPNKELRDSLDKALAKFLKCNLTEMLMSQVWFKLTIRLSWLLEKELDNWSWKYMWFKCIDNLFIHESLVCTASYFDYCYSVLNCNYNPIEWSAFQALIKNCGWVLPFKGTCIVCDRPIKLSFDSQNNLHAEGEPAIEFADGYSLYFYHDVILPEEYGKIPPYEWQPQWLLKEENAEIRRLLIERIGYERICQELEAEELDNWQEYTLLKIDNADIEPIFLLKMNCPSTGRIHVLRVPPKMQTARAAIRWCNWGIDPEEFSLQS